MRNNASRRMLHVKILPRNTLVAGLLLFSMVKGGFCTIKRANPVQPNKIDECRYR
ncbi:hypothetical protein AVEN_189482-1, partial [Araneus ventricosus]